MSTTRKAYERLAFFYCLDDVMCLGAKQLWRRKIIDWLDVERSRTILDLATGPGMAAEMLATRAKDAQVVAVDFSRTMLRIARARTRKKDNLDFILCDASYLPFKDEIFDAASCMYGMDTVDQPEFVLAEANRVLRRGRRFGMVYFRMPKGWLRHFFAPLMKYYDLIWNAGYVDLTSMIARYPFSTIKKCDLKLGEAILVEKK